ncbi:hypothetical protein [Noviherbaspirillum sp.]|uniref:hypothetical protein n=1 Tax=Noviherbaspirillum sp. TaxID=1926288 RepID=UPI002FE39F16
MKQKKQQAATGDRTRQRSSVSRWLFLPMWSTDDGTGDIFFPTERHSKRAENSVLAKYCMRASGDYRIQTGSSVFGNDDADVIGNRTAFPHRNCHQLS